MSAAVSADLRRMTSQPTITLSAPAPHHPKPVVGNSGKGPALASANATPKQTSPVPLLTSSGQPHATPARSQSIPSSPTSIHSSSSAIFERDIEPINFQSSPLKNADPHHTSRAQVHESTEQAVPSVLTSAVSALSLSTSTPGSPVGGAYKRHSIYDDGEISVISPAPAVSSGPGAGNGGASLLLTGMATPRSLSRSPSPPATATFASTSQSYQQQSATGATSPVSILAGSSSRRSTSPRPATDATASSPPSSFKPVPAVIGDNTTDVTEAGSQTSRVDPINAGSPMGSFVVGSGPIPRTRPSQTSLVTPVGGPDNFAADEALSTSSPNNRLSFISYHDLLVSTPLSAAPLSSITSGVSQPESLPPASASLSASLSNSIAQAASSPTSALPGHRSGTSSPSPPRGRSAAAHATIVGWGKEDGGEWEREGLGKGLEERLEEVLAAEKTQNEQTHSPTR